jgi:hypothetical protein
MVYAQPTITATASLDIDRPIPPSTKWTPFESLPGFVEGVEQIGQDDTACTGEGGSTHPSAISTPLSPSNALRSASREESIRSEHAGVRGFAASMTTPPSSHHSG